MLADVRCSLSPLRLLAVLSLSAACSAPPDAPRAMVIDRPTVPLAVQWPAGQRFRVALAATVEDSERSRAALVWWREALRQTVAFELHEASGRDLPELVLSLGPERGPIAAVLRTADGERALAGTAPRDRELPAMLDELAWATRMALGETCEPPVPIALGTSRSPKVLLAVDDAMVMLRDGSIEPAYRLLLQARRLDGGSPFVLEALAAVELLRGQLPTSERIATEALGYPLRLLPTVQHRLLRTLLLVRASRPGAPAAQFDQELQRLGEVGRRERPHDPQPEFTTALAENFLGAFAAARPRLQALRTRLPDQPIVAYHLGWACLGSGDAAAAIDPLEFAAARLPVPWLLLPRAIALHEAGRHDELLALLERLRADGDGDGRGLEHELNRMLAAAALLRGDAAGARKLLVADLVWLLQHPQLLAQRVGEFAEQGALLVRLGGDEQLPSLLAAVQQQHAGEPVADACAFVSGLLEVRRRRERLTALEDQLARGGDSVFEALLCAYAHELRGELADQQAALSRASRLGDSPLTKTLLARCLVQAGRRDEGTALLQRLRQELRTIALRQRCQHPLCGPELAYAFVDD
jgi:tetratricopeptide (TPR) repeat protein